MIDDSIRGMRFPADHMFFTAEELRCLGCSNSGEVEFELTGGIRPPARHEYFVLNGRVYRSAQTLLLHNYYIARPVRKQPVNQVLIERLS